MTAEKDGEKSASQDSVPVPGDQKYRVRTPEESAEYNRWSIDSKELTKAAAEACLSLLGVTRDSGEGVDIYFSSVVSNMTMPIAGGTLGDIGPGYDITEETIPEGYKRVGHPQSAVYIKRVIEPADQRGHVTNDPGYFQVLVRSTDPTWQHQFMKYGFWVNTAKYYQDSMKSHRAMIAKQKAGRNAIQEINSLVASDSDVTWGDLSVMVVLRDDEEVGIAKRLGLHPVGYTLMIARKDRDDNVLNTDESINSMLESILAQRRMNLS